MEILCIIPARAGSKGIKNKNIQKLNGKHLIEYVISSAKKSKLINRVIVSTDGDKKREIAEKVSTRLNVPLNIVEKEDKRDYVVNFDRIKNEFNFEPTRITDKIKELVEFYQNSN